MSEKHTLAVFVPVSRGRALVRVALLFALGAALAVVSLSVIGGLKFTPSAVSNRIEDYALACLMIPVAIAALWLAWRGTAWLLLAAWPGRLDIEATDAALTFRLGPFGCSVYDARRLDVKYPYELSTDEESAQFEAFVPEEEQIKNFLPQISHPDVRGSIRLEILKFAKETEPMIAQQLRPLIVRWRGHPDVPG